MIYFVVPAQQEFGMRDYLAVFGKPMAERIAIVHYESLPRRTRFNRGTYILAALDQLGPAMERFTTELFSGLVEADGVRILNHPVETLRRFELLSELQRLNYNEFGIVRASGDISRLRYPVFIRSERSHIGAISPLLHSAHEVEAGIGRALVQGYRLRDLLVVEFCDTSDASGYYRKYAAFVVGKHVIPRSLNYGPRWMLKHGGTEFTRSMVVEERDYVMGNPHESQLTKIFDVARVAYGRMDYALKDGRVQTWEINLNPTIGRGQRLSRNLVPVELEPVRQETKDRFYQGFQNALEEVDLTMCDESAVSIALDARIIRTALSENIQGRRRFDGIRKVLGSVKPVLDPVAARMLPILGKLVRLTGARGGRALT